MKKIIAYGWLGVLASIGLGTLGYAVYASPSLRFILLVITCGVAFGLFTSWAVSETLK